MITNTTAPQFVFLEAIEQQFGRVDFIPITDGSIQRFHVPGDKPGTRDGAYAFYPDSIPWGWFGTWRDCGHWHYWHSRMPASPREEGQVRQRIAQAKLQRAAEELKRWQSIAWHAEYMWRNAVRADPRHPYLITKDSLPHGLRQAGGALLVPLYFNGELVNLQRIGPDGQKRFLSGGRIKGCYSPLGTIKPNEPLYECEGWATGATIYEETSHPVACAMTAGNLLEVGRHLRCRYPEAVLIVAGDDDRMTKGNPGRTAAIMTATALGCEVTFPKWPIDAPLHLSDVNDLRQWLRRSKV